MEDKKVDLKQDKGAYETHIAIYKDSVVNKRKYFTNEPIDCFHRLYLSPEVLRILYRIGILERKLRENDESTAEIVDKTEKLEGQLQEAFYNPYKLDRESYSDDSISYIFYDYEYDYILEHTRGGWYIWCRHSNTWSDGVLCDMDD